MTAYSSTERKCDDGGEKDREVRPRTFKDLFPEYHDEIDISDVLLTIMREIDVDGTNYDLMDGVFEDLERYREAQKARRSTRAKKVYSSTDQVKNLKYLVEDVDAKVHSINPTLLPKATVLWMYNVKTRKLTEFKSNSINGFEIRGSTLYKWDNGRITTLRKPDEILPQIINKTEKQIDNIWKALTTKIGKPTGRINKDCILLRVE